MTDAVSEPKEGPKKASKLPMIIGIVLALAGGGGGFYAVQSGMLPFGGKPKPDAAEETAEQSALPAEKGALSDVGFVEVPPLVISLGPGAASGHLRFRASLEVPKAHLADVEAITPRVQDVLNSYLRALEPADFNAPGALIRIRSQMLRRVQLVAGQGKVRDLLVLEFVLT